MRQKIGFIYGESQIGKTTRIEAFERRNNHRQTGRVEIPPTAGVQLMTREIAKALHVSSKTCFEKLIEEVIDALGKSKLLSFGQSIDSVNLGQSFNDLAGWFGRVIGRVHHLAASVAQAVAELTP